MHWNCCAQTVLSFIDKQPAWSSASLILHHLVYMFFLFCSDYEFLTDNWIKIFPVKPLFGMNWWAMWSANPNNYIRGLRSCGSITRASCLCMVSPHHRLMAIGFGIPRYFFDGFSFHTFATHPDGILVLLKAADTGQTSGVFRIGWYLVFIVVQIITDMVVIIENHGVCHGLEPRYCSSFVYLLGFIGLIVAPPLTHLYHRFIGNAMWPKNMMKLNCLRYRNCPESEKRAK